MATSRSRDVLDVRVQNVQFKTFKMGDLPGFGVGRKDRSWIDPMTETKTGLDEAIQRKEWE